MLKWDYLRHTFIDDFLGESSSESRASKRNKPLAILI